MTHVNYAIGDIHGCLSEFQELLDLIDQDMAGYPAGTNFRIVQVGDLIDRGEDSRGTIELCMELPDRYAGKAEIVILKGNHEDVLIRLYDGDISWAKNWYINEKKKAGGIETMRSYGAPVLTCHDTLEETLLPQIKEFIPEDHIEYIRNLPTSFEDNTYFFAHAGIDPKRPLSEQTDRDLMWARWGFVDVEFDHDKIIVHGHTPERGGEILAHRVNVDAGAAYGLHLHCAVLEPDHDAENTRILSVDSGIEENWVDGLKW